MSTRLSYTVATATEATGLSRQTIIRAIHSGALTAKRSGQNDGDDKGTGRYIILADSLRSWLHGLEDA